MSYYDDLGTIPSASAEEIKARWRRMSSEYHPDKAGGSVEAMQVINKAYEVLGDPERRAKYDATGCDAEAPVIEDEALNMLMGALRQALDSDQVDPLECASRVLEAVRQQLVTHCASQTAEIKRMQKLTGRFKVKQGENLVQGMVETRLASAKAQLANLQRGQKVNEMARGMLTNYSFDAPVPETSPYASQMGQQRVSMLQALGLQSLRS